MFLSSCVKRLTDFMNSGDDLYGDSSDLVGIGHQNSRGNGTGQTFSTASVEMFLNESQTRSQSIQTSDNTV